jgi:hypothetical protein
MLTTRLHCRLAPRAAPGTGAVNPHPIITHPPSGIIPLLVPANPQPVKWQLADLRTGAAAG